MHEFTSHLSPPFNYRAVVPYLHEFRICQTDILSYASLNFNLTKLLVPSVKWAFLDKVWCFLLQSIDLFNFV